MKRFFVSLLKISIPFAAIDAAATSYATFLYGNNELSPFVHLLIAHLGFVGPFIWFPIEAVTVPIGVIVLSTSMRHMAVFLGSKFWQRLSPKFWLYFMLMAYFYAIFSNFNVILFGVS